MNRALREHWPEYLLEATALGLFMISSGVFTALFEYPYSLVHQAIADPFVRRIFIGMAMGLTASGLIFSPLGKRSGAHMNPAVTLTFLRLGKIRPWDAFFYLIAQFIGGFTGVFVVAFFIGKAFAHPSVNYVVTVPGPAGDWVAFVAEFIIAFFLMLDGAVCQQQAWPRTLDWCFRRMSRGDLHHFRSAVFRDEHEPRANVRLGGRGIILGGALDLFHCAGSSHATCRGTLRALKPHCLLRQASPS